jgi:RNA polymerase-binding transcription factor DksA
MEVVARTREQLTARLETLESRLREIDGILRDPEDQDIEERANDWDDEEVLDRLAKAFREEIGLIRAALSRVVDGSYGRCQTCGRSIGRRRLRAMPEAATCLRCAELAA